MKRVLFLAALCLFIALPTVSCSRQPVPADNKNVVTDSSAQPVHMWEQDFPEAPTELNARAEWYGKRGSQFKSVSFAIYCKLYQNDPNVYAGKMVGLLHDLMDDLRLYCGDRTEQAQPVVETLELMKQADPTKYELVAMQEYVALKKSLPSRLSRIRRYVLYVSPSPERFVSLRILAKSLNLPRLEITRWIILEADSISGCPWDRYRLYGEVAESRGMRRAASDAADIGLSRLYYADTVDRRAQELASLRNLYKRAGVPDSVAERRIQKRLKEVPPITQ